ncbi:hypothetical protein [Paraburkholderia sp. MM6662-R1]
MGISRSSTGFVWLGASTPPLEAATKLAKVKVEYTGGTTITERVT